MRSSWACLLLARLVLAQPSGSNSATALEPGQQQTFTMAEGEYRYFTVSADGHTAEDLSISAMPTYGDADILVNAAPTASPRWPNSAEDPDWEEQEAGADLLTILAEDEGACAATHPEGACTYFVAIYAYSACDVAVTASWLQMEAAAALLPGAPARTTVPRGMYQYYSYEVASQDEDVHITLTSLTGDCDLYASFTTSRPTSNAHTWESIRGDAEADTLTLDASDPAWPGGGFPRTLHIAVHGYDAPAGASGSEYTLVAGPLGGGDGGGASSTTQLVLGLPQQDHLSQGDQKYYTFSLAAGTEISSLLVTVTPLDASDPDLLVSAGGVPDQSCAYSDGENGCWGSAEIGADVVEISAARARQCEAPSCVYTVRVDAYSDTTYSLLVRVQAPAELGTLTTLQAGVPFRTHTNLGEYAYFRFGIEQYNASVEVAMTVFSGDPDLYASFILQRPSRSAYNFSSAEVSSSEVVRVSHLNPHFCPSGPPCSLYIAVYGYSNATFSLIATQHEEAVRYLVDGQPQVGSVRQTEWAYYRFTVPDGSPGFTLSLAATLGDPDLYVTAPGPNGEPATLPQLDLYGWAARNLGADELTISPDQIAALDGHEFCTGCTYVVGVYGWQESDYVLTAARLTAGGESHPVTLLDGLPTTGEVAAGATKRYDYFVSNPHEGVDVRLDDPAGDLNLFASFEITRPDRYNTTFYSTAGGTTYKHLRISPTEAHFCHADGLGTCVLHLAVYAPPDLWSEVGTFSITVTQYDEAAVQLYDGAPQHREDAADDWSYFKFSVGDAALSNFELLHEGAQCASGNTQLSLDAALGSIVTVQQCATQCSLHAGCEFFSFGKAGRLGECYMESTSHAGCDEGWVPGDFDFYELLPSFLLVRTGGSCSSSTSGFNEQHDALSGPGSATYWSSPSECAIKCANTPGCTNFAYGRSPEQMAAGHQTGMVACYVAATGPANADGSLADCTADNSPCGACTWREGYSEYHVSREAQGTTEFTVSVSASSGDPDIYITSNGVTPSSSHYTWAATAWGEDAVTVDAHDPGWCSSCTYLIGVHAAGLATSYAITASTSAALTMLEDGVPHEKTLAGGEVQYFRLYVPRGGQTGFTVTLTPLSGQALSLRMSPSEHRPNATTALAAWSSDLGFDPAQGSLAPVSVEVPYDDDYLQNCEALSYVCVVYVAVEAPSAATYTILANLNVRDTGLTVTAPTEIADNYMLARATFGPPLPVGALSAELALTGTPDELACDDVSHDLSNKVALVHRGQCTFVEKALNVQAAGASGMIVYNYADSLIRMGAYADAQVSDVTIPSVLIEMTVGETFKAAIESGTTVSVKLFDPDGIPSVLRSGVPQAGSADADTMRYYSFSLQPPVCPATTGACEDDDTTVAAACAANAANCGEGKPLGLMDTCAKAIAAQADSLRAACSARLIGSFNVDGSVGTVADACCAACAAACDCEEITISATASYGDADIFVSEAGADGSVILPTSTHYDYAATAAALDDAIVIPAASSPSEHGCSATYTIGVLAAGGSSCSYSVVAATASALITVQLGVPTFERVTPGHPHTFRVLLSATNVSAFFSLEALSGRPSLHVANVPGGVNAPSSTGDHSVSTGTGSGSAASIVAWTAEQTLSQCAGRGLPCTLYVTVSAEDETPSSFWLSVYAMDLGIWPTLRDGQPAAGYTYGCQPDVDGDGVTTPYDECIPDYYIATVADSDVALTVSATLDWDGGRVIVFASPLEQASGEYVLPTRGSAAYTSERQDLAGDGEGGATLTIQRPADGAWCAHSPCAFAVGVLVDVPYPQSFEVLATGTPAADGSTCNGERVPGNSLACFEYQATPASWNDAEAACVSRSGHLARIDSTLENEIVWKLCHVSGGECWIGFNDIEHETGWVWVDGVGGASPDASGFEDGNFPWAPGEPNGQAQEITDAAYIYTRNGDPNKGMWDDTDITYLKPFVCRRELDSSGDGAAAVSYVALRDGAVHSTELPSAERDQWHYYAYVVDSVKPIMVTLTPFGSSDEAHLAASFSSPSPVADAQWHESADALQDADALHLTIYPGAAHDAVHFGHGCDELPCVLHIGVVAGTSYTLSATQAGTLALQAGVPQAGELEQQDVQMYSLTLPAGHHGLSASLTALSGDPDLYISVGAKPTTEDYELSSRSIGADAIEIPRADARYAAGGACADGCTYYILVYAYSATTYTLTVNTPGEYGAPTRLQAGMPVTAHAERGEYAYFEFDVATDADQNVEVALTVLLGDPDLVASFATERPTVAVGDQEFIADGTGDDVITISHMNPLFCPAPPPSPPSPPCGGAGQPACTPSAAGRPPCTLHIGVYGYSNATFTIVATQHDEAVVFLVDGQPQVGSVPAHAWRYYQYRLPAAGGAGFNVAVQATTGDPDVYISTGEAVPTQSDFGWSGTRLGGDEVRVSDGDDAFCTECTYLIGLYGWSASEYTITLTRVGGDGDGVAPYSLLQAGVPVAAEVDSEAYRYYRMTLEPASGYGVQLSLSPTSGDADLFASFTLQEPTLANLTDPRVFHSANQGDDFLVIGEDDPGFCPGGAGSTCTLYIGVYGFGNTAFTLLATQDVEAPTRLFDGQPVAMTSEADEWRYFKFTAGVGITEFTVAAQASVGDPDIFISNDGQLPTSRHSQWHADTYGEDAVTVDAHDPDWCDPAAPSTAALPDRTSCEYTIGVHAFGMPATYSISASTAGALVVLEDGVPHESSAAAGESRYFRLYVPAGGMTGAVVTVTPLSGSASLYMAVAEDAHQPTAETAVWSAVATPGGSAALTVPSDDQTLVNCLAATAQCVLYIAVVAETACSFTVLGNLRFDDNGLSVVAPASLAHNYMLAAAAFGPLPTEEGLQADVALAVPREACGTGGGVLNRMDGKVALVDRGTCTFIEKVLNAQAAGAVAVLVANNDPDGVINMGGNDWNSAITIPAVMIRQEDGIAFRDAIGHGHPVTVVLSDPSHRPTELRAGMPQDGQLAPFATAHYSLTVSDAARVSLSVTPLSSDVDLYVRVGAGLPPRVDDYDYASADEATAGGDLVRLRADASDPFLASGVYQITIVNPTASDATFVLVGSTDASYTNLRAATPFYGVAAQGRPTFYKFTHSGEDALQFVLTGFAGDPDLCVTRNASALAQVPSQTGAGLEAATATFVAHISAVCTWYSGLVGKDVLTIPHTDAHGGEGTYYVAAFTLDGSEAHFQMLAKPVGDTPVLLLAGQPQVGHMASGEWSYYTLSLPSTTRRVTLSLTPTQGDPDLYVRADDVQPTRVEGGYQAASTEQGLDVLALEPAELEWLTLPATLQIGLFAWSETDFSIVGVLDLNAGCPEGMAIDQCVATANATLTPATLLQPNLPLIADLDNTGGFARFDFNVGDGSREVQLSMTPVYGDPVLLVAVAPWSMWQELTDETTDIFAQSAADQIAQHEQFNANHQSYASSATLAPGSDTVATCLTLQRTDYCVLHVAVVCVSSCGFSVLASVADDGGDHPPTILVDGRPQSATIDAGDIAYFSFLLPEGASGLILSMSSTSGSPALYATADGPEGSAAATEELRPGAAADEHTWTATADGLLLLGSAADTDAGAAADANFCSGCTYHLAISAGAAGATVTLTASSLGTGEHPVPVRLQDGVPAISSAAPGTCAPFSLRLGDVDATTAEPIAVSLTSFSGLPTLYMLRQDVPTDVPDASNHGAADPFWPGVVDSAFGAVEAEVPLEFVRRHPGGTYRIAVCAGAVQASFAVTARLSPDQPLALSEGVPTTGAAAAGQWDYFTLALPAAAETGPTVRASLALLSGAAELHVAPLSEFAAVKADSTLWTWTTSAASTEVLIRATDAHYCAGCEYVLGVRGVTAATFTLTFTLEPPDGDGGGTQEATRLQAGVPTAVMTSEAGGSRCFSYVHTQRAPLRVAVTPIAGDPDVYVSTEHERPNAASATWSTHATGRTDVVAIAETDARLIQGTYHVCVGAAASAATYSVLIYTEDLHSHGPTVVRLVGGQPQQAAVDAGGWAYFRYTASADVFATGGSGTGGGGLLFRVAPRFGEPDLYLTNTAAANTELPSREQHRWQALSGGPSEDYLLARRNDAGYCQTATSGCEYTLGVYAARASNFSVTAAPTDGLQYGLQLLQLGMPAAGKYEYEQPSYYKMMLPLPAGADPKGLDLNLALTAGSASAALSAHAPPQTHTATDRQIPTVAAGSIALAAGLQLQPAEVSELCAPDDLPAVCALYVTVQPSSDARWSVTANWVDDGARTALLYEPHAAAAAVSDAMPWRFYTLMLDAADAAAGVVLTLTLTCDSGQSCAGLYVALDGRPTVDTWTQRQLDATLAGDKHHPDALSMSLTLDGADGSCARGCAYHVGVHRRDGHTATYQLQARSLAVPVRSPSPSPPPYTAPDATPGGGGDDTLPGGGGGGGGGGALVPVLLVLIFGGAAAGAFVYHRRMKAQRAAASAPARVQVQPMELAMSDCQVYSPLSAPPISSASIAPLPPLAAGAIPRLHGPTDAAVAPPTDSAVAPLTAAGAGRGIVARRDDDAGGYVPPVAPPMADAGVRPNERLE